MNSLLQRISKDISETFARPERSDAERYVSQAIDLADVERRIREIERADISIAR